MPATIPTTDLATDHAAAIMRQLTDNHVNESADMQNFPRSVHVRSWALIISKQCYMYAVQHPRMSTA